MYSKIYESTIIEFRGGFYQLSDGHIYYLTPTGVSSIGTHKTKLLAENITEGIEFDEAHPLKFDSDNNIFEDIEISMDRTKSSSTLAVIPKNNSRLAIPTENAFPVDTTTINKIVRTTSISKTLLEFSRALSSFVFLVQTGAYNLALIEMKNSGGGMWRIRYQAWNVQYQIFKREAGIPSDHATHRRISAVTESDSDSAIIHTLDSLTSVVIPTFYNYERDRSRYGALFGDFEKIATFSIAFPSATVLCQVTRYGKHSLVTSDSTVKIIQLGDKTASTPGLDISPKLSDPLTSVLVRRNPVYPGLSRKIQLIVADFNKTSSKFYLLESDITDLTTSPKATQSTIAFKNQDGSTYTFAPGELWDLSWANDEQTAFYVPEPSKNRVIRFALSPDGKEATFEAEYVGMTEPRTVLVASPTQLYVICKNEIGSLRIDPEFDTGYDVLGIGFVPFSVKDKSSGMDVDIIHKTTGLANTSKLQNWPLYAKDLSFGDKLSLMINHKSLHDNGIRYYDVTLIDPTGPKPYPIVNQFTDIRGGSETFTDVKAGKYPIRDTPDDWYFPHLAAVIDTNNVLSGKSGVFELRVRFYEEYDGKEVGTTFSRNVSIDNRTPSVEIGQPKVGMVEVGSCGSVSYDNKSTDKLLEKCTFKFDGTGIPYSISTYCGSSYVKDFSQSGTTTKMEEEIKIEGTVSSALGACEAGLMSIRASIGKPVTNGYSVYTHGASQALYFALYPKPKP